MGPFISVVTPSLNQGRFIEETIRSVGDQDFTDFEHFVADGGSSDGTIEILQKFDSRIRWISEKDNGQAAAVNKGIANTTGEIIGWLNSDDIYYKGALRRVHEFFKTHPEANIVYGKANHIDEEGRVLEPYYTERWNFERLKEVCFLCQPAVFFRRKLIGEFGLLDERLRYCMDYEYWLRLAERGEEFYFLEKLLAGSRIYGENKTLGERRGVHAEINKVMKSKFGRVPDIWIFNYAHAVLDAKGLSREKKWRFAAAVSALSLFAALRWNKSVSPEMMRTTIHWVFDHSKRAFFQLCKR